MNLKLNDLFEKWYKYQCETEQKEDTAFIFDGSLSDTYIDQHDILFVCRESHTTVNCKETYFWLKNVVDGKCKGGKKYYNCINMIATYIKGTTDLNKCAYMNINKKGGTTKCRFDLLNEYAKKYRNYIIKEIEIINPNCIVILGKLSDFGAVDAENLFVEYGKKHNISVYLYDKHPCVYSKDIKNHIFLK